MKWQSSQTPYGTKTIVFRLCFEDAHSLRFTVHPDQSVEVVAPVGAQLDAIKERVRKRGAWICKQQAKFDRCIRETSTKGYLTGESFRYLGRQYRLRVTDGKAPGVALSRGSLEVRVLDRTKPQEVARSLDSWYRERAKIRFAERFQVCLLLVRRYGILSSGFRLLRMKKRWGSCTASGAIILNPELVKAPVECIDYVIIHELCHLKEFEHGAGFYRLLRRLCPDWERRKRRLERIEF